MKLSRKALKTLLHRLQDGRCCYCNCVIDLAPKFIVGAPHPDHFATIEHLRKVADGGTDHPDNLALACKRCNSARGNASWVEFKTMMAAA